MLNAIYSNNCIFTRAPYFLCANELSVIEIQQFNMLLQAEGDMWQHIPSDPD